MTDGIPSDWLILASVFQIISLEVGWFSTEVVIGLFTKSPWVRISFCLRIIDGQRSCFKKWMALYQTSPKLELRQTPARCTSTTSGWSQLQTSMRLRAASVFKAKPTAIEAPSLHSTPSTFQVWCSFSVWKVTGVTKMVRLLALIYSNNVSKPLAGSFFP